MYDFFVFFLFFFFQAEDGIRDRNVTGVQTCALPICCARILKSGTKRAWPGTWRSARRASACIRSEEHTSELQSRFDLVCRLLLEKKKSRTDGRRPVPLLNSLSRVADHCTQRPVDFPH